MLFRILNKNKVTFKSTITKVFFYVFIWFFFVYIIISLLTGLMNKYIYVDVYNYCNFDLTIDGAYIELYKELEENNDFIGSSLKTFYTGEPIYNEMDQAGSSNIMRIDSDNFDEFFKFFPKKHFISLDEALVKQKDSALIMFDMAKLLDVDVGDYVEIAGNKYRVAGIFEPALFNVINCDMVILWDGKGKSSEIQSGKPDFFMCYTKVFIIFNDYDRGIDFLEKTYFKQSIFLNNFYMSQYHKENITRYGRDWAKLALNDLVNGTIPQEEFTVSDFKENMMIKKKTLHAIAKINYEDSFNLEEDVFYSGLCVAALFSVCILESYQHAKKNQTKVAIMRILGYKRFRIFLFYFLRSFFIQSILMVCGIGFTKYMPLRHSYISSILITKWFFTFSAIIAVAAFLSSLVSMKRLRDDKLLQKLNEES